MRVNTDVVARPPGKAAARPERRYRPKPVQPIIRYDLNDSILVNPERCPCGNRLPAIRVEGRRDDVVSVPGRDGNRVRLLPLALTTVVEEILDTHRFQIVQTVPSELTVRLGIERVSEREAAWQAVAAALRTYRLRQSLPDVRLVLDRGRPVIDRRSGKLRQVVPATQRHSRTH